LSPWLAPHIPYRHNLSRAVVPRLFAFPPQCLCTTHSARYRCSPVHIQCLHIFCNPLDRIYHLPVLYQNSADNALPFALPQTVSRTALRRRESRIESLADSAESVCRLASRSLRSSSKHAHLPEFSWCAVIAWQVVHHRVLRHPSCFTTPRFLLLLGSPHYLEAGRLPPSL